MNASVIIPVKNEPYLRTLLKQLTDYEVLVQTEKGLGYAVMCGIKRCHRDVVAICDADGSHPVKEIPAMINLTEEYDIVIGSRYNGGATEDSFARELISRIYCKFAQVLFGLSVKDSMSGFVVAKKEVFTTYPIKNNGFKFLLDILVRSKGVYNVVEYPIVFEKRKAGKSKANYKEAFLTLVFMLKLKLELL